MSPPRDALLRWLAAHSSDRHLVPSRSNRACPRSSLTRDADVPAGTLSLDVVVDPIVAARLELYAADAIDRCAGVGFPADPTLTEVARRSPRSPSRDPGIVDRAFSAHAELPPSRAEALRVTRGRRSGKRFGPLFFFWPPGGGGGAAAARNAPFTVLPRAR